MLTNFHVIAVTGSRSSFQSLGLHAYSVGRQSVLATSRALPSQLLYSPMSSCLTGVGATSPTLLPAPLVVLLLLPPPLPLLLFLACPGVCDSTRVSAPLRPVTPAKPGRPMAADL